MMRSVILTLLLGVSCAASAQLYRWTDENGRVHLTDTPPPPSAKNVQTRSSTVGDAAAPQAAGQPYALQLAARNYPVTLFTAPECEPCGDARRLLNERGVPFREVSVVDGQQAEELKKVAGGLSVPTISVGSSVQKGFEEGSYHALLDTAGYPRAGILPPRNQTEPKPAPQPAETQAAPAEEAAPAGPYSPGSSATGVRARVRK
jgi:glutaredoxin